MSEWLRLVNQIKARSPVDLFTPTQHAAYTALLDLLRFPQQVNLCGPVGSGKTFVAWGVAQSLGGLHVPLPTALDQLSGNNDILLVDNAPAHEYEARNLLARCNLLGAQSTVLVTQQPIAMPMRRVELPLPTPEEVVAVSRSLSLLGYFQSSLPLPSQPNFWNILQSFVQ